MDFQDYMVFIAAGIFIVYMLMAIVLGLEPAHEHHASTSALKDCKEEAEVSAAIIAGQGKQIAKLETQYNQAMELYAKTLGVQPTQLNCTCVINKNCEIIHVREGGYA